MAILNKELENFLYKEGPERSPADVLQAIAVRDTEMLTAVVEADRAAKNKEEYLNMHKTNYSRYLAAYLMDLLNGNQEIIAIERKRLFSAALYVAQQLEKHCENLLKEGISGGRDAKIARELLTAYHDVNGIVLKGLNDYEQQQLPLVDYLETKEIRQLESRKIDTSILVREYLYDDAMETKLYEDYLGEKVRNEHLPRFVWHCRENDSRVQIRLKLAVDRLEVIQPSAEIAENAGMVTLLPEILLQSLWNMDITPYLETAHPDTQDVAGNVYEKSTPLILFEKNRAVRHTLKMFLSLKKSSYLDELVKHLRSNFPSRGHVKGTDFRDAHSFSSVSVLDSLPLPALRPYEQSMGKYLALPVNHRRQIHVFAAEQNASVYEDMLPNVEEPKGAFHPAFLSHLEHLEHTRLFASCAVYGLTPNLFQYDVERYYLDIPDNTGQNRCFLTEKDDSQKSTPLDALHAFIKGKGKTGSGEHIPIPIKQIRDFLKNNPPSKEHLLGKEKEITTMKGDEEISSEVKNLLSFIHLILNEELKNLEDK
jgi:hypothetical protein